ncbi:hypothetical protein SESBI_15327 [Sesbania bispinosa]|nr:hypothetical protein SESBI_15327 [Sesbania bispinosa]
MNQEVVKVILECKQDIWSKKDKELFSLVEDFFENSLQTLDFCNALEKCLKRAREKLVVVKSAMTYFEEEKLQIRKQKLDKKLKSLKTLRRVSNCIFVAAFVSVLIFSVVAAAIAAPPVCSKRPTRSNQFNAGWYLHTLVDLNNIRARIDQLDIKIESMLQTADFALRNEDAV